MTRPPRVVILGGGPAGYEAALVAAQAGVDVALVERDGLGGSAVLTDCVPSKALIASSTALAQVQAMENLGVRISPTAFDLREVNRRILDLARAQSADVRRGLERAGVRLETGAGRLGGPRQILVREQGRDRTLEADVILLAAGARPRPLDGAAADGERILT